MQIKANKPNCIWIANLSQKKKLKNQVLEKLQILGLGFRCTKI